MTITITDSQGRQLSKLEAIDKYIHRLDFVEACAKRAAQEALIMIEVIAAKEKST